jgi:uncharacterized protein YcaQ
MVRRVLTLDKLRARAAAHTLFRAGSLRAAVHQLGFVQADPIRAPARAQDLILRQRVPDYRAGDLEREYAALDIEEDYLYAYGFLPSATSRLLRPRATAKKPLLFDKKVLALVTSLRADGEQGVHPRDLDAHLGKKRVINAWGGYSQATKRSLERLHHYGLLRVVGRRAGVRLYAPVALDATAARSTPRQRFRALVLVIANVLAPVPERTLHSMAAKLRGWMPTLGSHRDELAALLRDGQLEADDCQGVRYLWPAADAPEPPESERRVRLLAPFDPLVWDRSRFEQLYGWSYRFEAYTPLARRIRGYYALPLLWGTAVIGWANASLSPDKSLDVQVGFVGARPAARSFTRELDAEIERLRLFLTPR